jgi:hypothetical protein
VDGVSFQQVIFFILTTPLKIVRVLGGYIFIILGLFSGQASKAVGPEV